MKTKIITFAMILLSIITSGNVYSAKHQPQPVSAFAKTSDNGDFASFRARRMNNNSVMLQWAVINPLMVQAFVVERSVDGENFSALAELSSSGYATYTYRDRTLYPGNFWYRIIVYNYDGTYSVSEIESIRISRCR